MHASACEVCSLYLTHPLREPCAVLRNPTHLESFGTTTPPPRKDPLLSFIFALFSEQSWISERDSISHVWFWVYSRLSSLHLRLWQCNLTRWCGWIWMSRCWCKPKNIWRPRGSRLIKESVVLLLSGFSTIFLCVSFLELALWRQCIAVGSERLLRQSLCKELYCKYLE